MYLAQDIQAFVMYCVDGVPGSSLLIESTDSMIFYTTGFHIQGHKVWILELELFSTYVIEKNRLLS